MSFPPRLIRQTHAAAYLGMSEPTFNAMVRPHIQEISAGGRAIWYDRLDLDAWADQFKAANGKAIKGERSCQKQRQAYASEASIGTVRKPLPESEFGKALERRNSKRPSAT